jgi:membrane-associated protease RseP (regulator of RpoE activity)
MSELIRAIPPMVSAPVERAARSALRPTAREWARHAGLFALTVLTTTIAGIMLTGAEPPEVIPRKLNGVLDYLLYVPELYLKSLGAYVHMALAQPTILAHGLAFAGSLLAILTAHESGHYVACRLYKVDATLPFFIPSPPMIGPGTFGAFIKIKSPIPSRRALFDIGVAGPLAGFVIVVPVALIGLLTAQPAPPITGGEMTFNDPLLMRLMAKLVGVHLSSIAVNPFYLAAWIGLLVTSLNLLPVGQLDGGHAVYAVFGKSVHKWLGRAAFATMATLAVLGFVWHHSPGGFLYAVLLAVMLRVRHPQPQETEPLRGARLFVALLTLLVFALSFWPFPITFS